MYLLPTSEYESHCRRTRLSLATNTFYAGDEHFQHWRWTLLALETNAFELEMNSLDDCYSHSYLPLNRRYHIEEIQRYVDAQQRHGLHWIGLQGQVNKENVVELLLTHSCTRSVVSGCGLTNIPHLKYVNRSPRSRQTSTRGVFGDSFKAVAHQS